MNSLVQNVAEVFEALSKITQAVYWVRDASGKTQIYLSSSYEKIFGVGLNAVYADPKQWALRLLPTEKDAAIESSRARYKKFYMGDTSSCNVLYRVETGSDSLIHVIDHAFPVYDSKRSMRAVVGLAEPVPEAQWSTLKKSERNQHKSALQSSLRELALVMRGEFSQLPKIELALGSEKKTALMGFTPREQQCISALRKGLSAKETARELQISHRTVEKFIATIGQKLGCRTKLEILSALDSEFSSSCLAGDVID